MRLRFLMAIGLAASLALGVSTAQVVRESPAVVIAREAGHFVGFYYNGYRQLQPWREIQSNLVKQVNDVCGTNLDCPTSTGVGVVKTYLKSLNDPFTAIQTLDEAEEEIRASEGMGSSYPTFGLRVAPFSGGLVVREVYVLEPAFDTELKRGDLITTLNGQPATVALLAELERSQKPVKIDYSSQGASKSASLTAKVVEEGRTPVRSALEGNSIMLMRIPNMWLAGDRVHSYVARAIRDNVKGIIVDLRDSLTGYDTEAQLAAGAFGSEISYLSDSRFPGKDYQTAYRAGGIYFRPDGQNETKVAEVQRPQTWRGKVVVLVNAATENSSEMLAYWLQQHGATVIGSPTNGQLGVTGSYSFGETLFQMVNSDLVRVSTNRMKTIAGQAYPERVTPDILLADADAELVAGRDVVLNRAIAALR
jgi:carboxyl-terminal processing protease